MKCHDINNKMMDLIYNEISPNEKKDMLDHINECDRCRTEYEELKGTSELLNNWPEKDTPVKFVFAENKKINTNWNRVTKWLKYPVAAAAVLLVVLSLANFQISSENGSFSLSMSLKPQNQTNTGNYVTLDDLDKIQKQNLFLTNELIDAKYREQAADNYTLISQFAKGMEMQRKQDMDVILTNLTQFQRNNYEQINQTNQNFVDLIKYTGMQIKRDSNK